MLVLASSMVWPSGCARATSPVAIVPPAAALVLDTMVPSSGFIRSAQWRATDVVHAAGRERHHQLDRPLRIGALRERRERQRGRRQQDEPEPARHVGASCAPRPRWEDRRAWVAVTPKRRRLCLAMLPSRKRAAENSYASKTARTRKSIVSSRRATRSFSTMSGTSCAIAARRAQPCVRAGFAPTPVSIQVDRRMAR